MTVAWIGESERCEYQRKSYINTVHLPLTINHTDHVFEGLLLSPNWEMSDLQLSSHTATYYLSCLPFSSCLRSFENTAFTGDTTPVLSNSSIREEAVWEQSLLFFFKMTIVECHRHEESHVWYETSHQSMQQQVGHDKRSKISFCPPQCKDTYKQSLAFYYIPNRKRGKEKKNVSLLDSCLGVGCW